MSRMVAAFSVNARPEFGAVASRSLLEGSEAGGERDAETSSFPGSPGGRFAPPAAAGRPA